MTNESYTEADKLHWEITKLRAEVESLHRPAFKTPTFVFAAIGAALGAFGAGTQWYGSSVQRDIVRLESLQIRHENDSLRFVQVTLDSATSKARRQRDESIAEASRLANDIEARNQQLASLGASLTLVQQQLTTAGSGAASTTLAKNTLDRLATDVRGSVVSAQAASDSAAALRAKAGVASGTTSRPFWVYLGEKAIDTGELLEARFGSTIPVIGTAISTASSVYMRNAMARNVDGAPVYGDIVGSVPARARLRTLAVDSVRVLWPGSLPRPANYRYWAQVEQAK